MRHLDLFSGIGGFALAARWVGWETVGFCEINPYCQKVLRKHWPDVPIYEDVRTLDARTVGHVDIITGGYPCQPFSVAGKRRGEADDRHLWPEFARLIRELRPRWVVGENVAGHIGMGLDDVLADLEGLGYTWETFIIPACAVSAPHRRDRIWTIAHPNSTNGRDKRQNEMSANRKVDQWKAKPYNNGNAEAMADPKNSICDGKRPKQGWQSRGLTDRGGWFSEPSICRVVDGLPNRSHRLKGLGNAIVPQIAEVIFRAIDNE